MRRRGLVGVAPPSLAVLAALASLVGCGRDAATPSAATATTRVVKDCVGVDVRVPASVRRVVTTAPGLTATVLAMGMGTTLVGVSDQDRREGALASLPRIAVYPMVPAESVAVLAPDVLLVDRVLSGKSADALRSRFPSTFVTDSSSTLDHLRETFLRVGDALGVPHRGRLLAETLDRARAHARVSGKPRVLVLGQVEPLPPYAIGPDGLLGDMVSSVGAENVAFDLKSSGPIASEVVVSRAPEWILHTGGRLPDALRRAWASVPALASKPERVVDIGTDEFQQGGPDTARALERLAVILSTRDADAGMDGR